MFDQTSLKRRKPLDGAAILHQELTIQPARDIGLIMVQRSNIVPDEAIEAIGRALGLNMPLQPCCKASNADAGICVLCTGPNAWIVVCEHMDEWALASKIEEKAGDATITATVTSDQFVCLNIEGGQARDLLAKGCALDLGERVFTSDHVARTLLAQANIVLWRMADGGFRLIFDVSLSPYLWRWLEGASEEYPDARDG